MEAAREQGRGDGGARVAFWLSWLLAGLCVAMFVASVPLLVLARSAHVPSSWSANLTASNFLGGILSLDFPLVGALIASVLSLVMRYRRSRGEERQQIKWIAFAASFVGLLYLIAKVCSFVFPSKAWFQAGSPLWLDLLAYAAVLSFTVVPVAVGFAVLRYRLYDIDVVINRTLVYAPLTAMLVALYAGGVVGLQYAFRALTGSGSQLAIVASTLLIAALLNPMRRRVQNFIDHLFYRRKYDAVKTLEAFFAKLRDETDVEQLHADLLSTVRETMLPEHISL